MPDEPSRPTGPPQRRSPQTPQWWGALQRADLPDDPNTLHVPRRHWRRRHTGHRRPSGHTQRGQWARWMVVVVCLAVIVAVVTLAQPMLSTSPIAMKGFAEIVGASALLVIVGMIANSLSHQ